ncbi:MAG: redox-sensing transcriptional repressor Rex [Clostridiales bacterium]|nr:redox-sensing transcriptional repressor Rex [Clostridiales bacterium]
MQIPLPTLKRLPIYYQYLTKMEREGVRDVSCAKIARDLGLVAVQVRKDLQLTGAVGRPKTGYQVSRLMRALSSTLGYDNKTEMFLVGAGSLGKALMGYKRFQEYNIGIAAAFDASEAAVGLEIGGTPVLPLSKFPSLCHRMHVKFGVICVPAEAAQEVADMMVSSGIEAIWNFAPVTLDVPDTVIVHNENLTASLSILLNKYKTSHPESERD